MGVLAFFAAAAVGQVTGLSSETVQALEVRRAEIEWRAGPVFPEGPTLPAEAGPVTESRLSIGAGSLTVPLVTDVGNLPAGAYVRRHEIVRAVDDLDRTVLASTNPGANSVLQARGAGPRFTRNLVFQPPQRGATAIKSVDGYLEILVPAEETGSLVRFPGFSGRAGQRLEHAALAASGMEVTLLTKEQYDGLKPQWEKSTASVAAAPNFATTVVLLVKDENRRFVGAELRDASGAILPGNMQMLSTNVLGTAVVVVRANSPLPTDAEMRLLLADPRALKIMRFHIGNVALP